MSRRWILGVVGVGSVAVFAYLAVAWRPALAPIDPPAPSSFAPDLVDKGRRLAGAAGCIDCHTVENGATGAGGVGFRRMLGTIYSSNITPDPGSGIGRWSLAAFTRALREGVARDGKHLFFAAFPFDHFSKLTDGDIGALYAYLMSLPPANTTTRTSSVPFPLDVRALQAAWKAIYLTPGPYRPDAAHDAQWNRGAYLAEAVAHCGSCHTPRNVLGAEEVGHPYGGALIDGWWATPLAVEPSPVRWTQAELATYLATGESVTHGVALGPMRMVVRRLRSLSDPDIAALAAYVTDLISYRPNEKAALARALSPPEPANEEAHQGSMRYLAVCGPCHDKPGTTADAARSPLGLSAALWMEEPNNFIRIVLDGVSREEDRPGPSMPGFRDKLSDLDIAVIVEYLRKSRTTLPAWGDMQLMVARTRALSAPKP